MNDDTTLGGYQAVHHRAPAFEGADGQPYSADTFVDEQPDAFGRYGAALLFLRWVEGGAKPLGHLETDYLAFGKTPAEALARVRALPLADVKAHLDACIAAAGS
jgi:hypothetical protein